MSKGESFILVPYPGARALLVSCELSYIQFLPQPVIWTILTGMKALAVKKFLISIFRQFGSYLSVLKYQDILDFSFLQIIPDFFTDLLIYF